MRYSRYALLLFGAGMLLGLAVVSAKLTGLGWVASLMMAAGIVLLPIAAIADWRRRAPRPRQKARAKPKPKSPKRGDRRQSNRQTNPSPPRKRGSRGR
jgi:hypothetical protein